MKENKYRKALPKGVYKTTHGNKYASNVVMRRYKGDGVITRYVGSFETPEEASQARKEFLLMLL